MDVQRANYEKVASIVDNILEKEDEQAFLNRNLHASIEKITAFINKEESFAQEGMEYIRQLRSRCETNQFALKKKQAEHPDFSAIWCVQINDLPGLRYLVRNEVEVNQQNRRGMTALHLAALAGKIECVRLLLLHPQIDTKILSKNGKTAEECAGEDMKILFQERK